MDPKAHRPAPSLFVAGLRLLGGSENLCRPANRCKLNRCIVQLPAKLVHPSHERLDCVCVCLGRWTHSLLHVLRVVLAQSTKDLVDDSEVKQVKVINFKEHLHIKLLLSGLNGHGLGCVADFDIHVNLVRLYAHPLLNTEEGCFFCYLYVWGESHNIFRLKGLFVLMDIINVTGVALEVNTFLCVSFRSLVVTQTRRRARV